MASCGGSSHRPRAATRGSATAPPTVTTVATGAASVAVPSGAALSCQRDPCYSPQQFRVAYGIQPLLTAGSTAVARR